MRKKFLSKQAIIKKFGSTLKKYCKKNGVSARKLATHSVLKIYTIKEILSGHYTSMCTLSTLKSLEIAAKIPGRALQNILTRAIGQRIKYLCNQRGISQSTLARRTNMSESHVKDLESGCHSIITPKEVVKLVHLFHVDGNFIICRTDKELVRYNANSKLMNIIYRPQDNTKSISIKPKSHHSKSDKGASNNMNSINLDLSYAFRNSEVPMNIYDNGKLIYSSNQKFNDDINNHLVKIFKKLINRHKN